MTTEPHRQSQHAAPDSLPVDAVLLLELPFTETELVGLRSAVAAHASEAGVPADRVEVLVFVAYELATNAVRHGGGSGRLQLWAAADVVYCRISDEGPGIPAGVEGKVRPEPGSPGSRGLWLVRTFAESMHITAGGGRSAGATVTAVIPFQR
ncbi:ATP-binding protein [Catellatospora vulcania]|uniref:ATP-binding protein n=1 Tax=Catellatospora vulcania TaxID=1460450 RepID=UPI0012D43C9D|nr:ATP-binding protein [Catellatospora vulcania]